MRQMRCNIITYRFVRLFAIVKSKAIGSKINVFQLKLYFYFLILNILFNQKCCDSNYSFEKTKMIIFRLFEKSKFSKFLKVRQLEAIVRIAESLAKMQLSPFATKRHVEEAIRLFKVLTNGMYLIEYI